MGTLRRYIKARRLIRRAINEERLLEKISRQFGTEFRTDWVDRIYTVINPHIQRIDSESTSLIFQFNKDNTMSNDVAIHNWVMKNLVSVAEFINDNNLMEILTYNIERLDADQNYLLVMQNLYFDDLKQWLKRLLIILLSVVGVGVAVLLLFNFVI